jgi:prenyltransferase beta subunit
MKRLTRLLLLLTPLLLTGLLLRGADCAEAERREPSNAVDLHSQWITPETQSAIDRGLALLAQRQREEDGSFGSGQARRSVAVSSLAGMALMASGSTPGRGPYGAHVDRCVDFVLGCTRQSGFILAEGASSQGPMYGHGFATLFLAESLGMATQNDLRDKLGRAVQLIVDCQNSEGGWRYQPQRRDADISVTVCQIMALRAARNAGIYVPRETIDRCTQYVRNCQNPDGGFRYVLQGGQSAFPRSAAGVVALHSAGIYATPEVKKGIAYLLQHVPQGSARNRQDHYFFYGHYYAVQAMWHAGGEEWQKWYPAIRTALLARQDKDGSWRDAYGAEYGTAMACLILQTPNGYLPIFQR